jgi:hypothetical protein
MNEIQTREIDDNDYEMLLKIEEKQKAMDAMEIPGVNQHQALEEFLTASFIAGNDSSIPPAI